MHVSLCYQPESEKLKLQIFAARNLPDSPSRRYFFINTYFMFSWSTIPSTNTSHCWYAICENKTNTQVSLVVGDISMLIRISGMCVTVSTNTYIAFHNYVSSQVPMKHMDACCLQLAVIATDENNGNCTHY
jgi:hypothetical protein